MKKLLLLCSALALVSTTSYAATRLAHVTHIQDRGYHCNTKTCYKVRTVFWRAESYGRAYRGQTNIKGNQYIGSTIYVDGLP